MKFFFHTDVYFENWDWSNSIDTGIGGSETHQVEMARRLAQRGHEVVSYGPVPPESDGAIWSGVKWLHHKHADFTAPGIWIIYRNPSALDYFNPKRDDQQLWFMAQDEWYDSFNDERVAKLDRFLPICGKHAESCIERCPALGPKTTITSNGIRVDLIREIEANGLPERNPHRLMYASSPDRGLKSLLKIFRRSREFVPDLELHAFYGFDNIDKLIAMDSRKFGHYRKLKSEIEGLMSQPGVTWHGRVGQRQLYIEMFKTGIWCYPTNFTETSCIQCMEMQAMGAIPITNPLWALAENVMHGVFISGDAYGDALMQARYSAEIVGLATQPDLQSEIRTSMMRDARFRFNWSRQVDQWESWVGGYSDRVWTTQYNYQLKHAKGRVLNVGCDMDLPAFGSHGGVNVDLHRTSPIVHLPTAAHIVADARNLAFRSEFDTVVLGDILEHMDDSGAIAALRSAKLALVPGGRIVLTVPNDSRPDHLQHDEPKEAYAMDESTFHRPVPGHRLHDWLAAADLKPINIEELDYTFADGWGVVAQ